ALYDFTPERSDELEAKVGDPVVILAQSNEEWYIAKHPNTAGGPGLIPISFVEVRDTESGNPVADIPAWLKKTGNHLPGVEEFRILAAEGKVPLEAPMELPPALANLRPPTVAEISTATVESYITQDDQYWFHIILQLKDGRKKNVYRLYEDFY